MADWVQRLARADVPCFPVNTIEEVVNDPQVRHLGIIQPVPYPEIPELRLCGSPCICRRTPAAP